jgi:hypothetical protein
LEHARLPAISLAENGAAASAARMITEVFLDAHAPKSLAELFFGALDFVADGMEVLVTITAPIRLPSKNRYLVGRQNANFSAAITAARA